MVDIGTLPKYAKTLSLERDLSLVQTEHKAEANSTRNTTESYRLYAVSGDDITSVLLGVSVSIGKGVDY